MGYFNLIPRSITNGIIVPELNGYTCLKNPNPKSRWEFIWTSGGFCQIYPLEKNGNHRKCLRIWFDSTSLEDRQHVKQVASYFSNNPVQYVIPFRYYEKALRLNNGIEIPGVVMDWIEGDKLIDYIRKHCREPELMKTLSENFYNMVSYLNRKGMSHGDLSGDNIIVKPDGSLCLIDYDSFFVPGFENVKQPTKGTGGYQHPGRKQSVYLTKTMDYFSQQVIFLSILGIAKQPELIYCFGEKEMLFSEVDLMNTSNFKQSKSYQALYKTKENIIKALLAQLENAISNPLNKVKPIEEIVKIKSDTQEQVKHTIYIKQPQHGLLLAYPPQAVAGEIIGVRCNNNKPDEYKIKEVNVIASGSVWSLSNQRRSQTLDSKEPFESVFGGFQMPDSDVTLEAVFEKTTKEPKQSIKCPSCNTNYYKTYSKYCHHCGMKRI